MPTTASPSPADKQQPTAADKLRETLDAIGKCLDSQSPMASGQAHKLLDEARDQVDHLPGATKAQPHQQTGQAADAPPTPGVNTEHFAGKK